MLRILILFIFAPTFTYCQETLNPVGLRTLSEVINRTDYGLCAFGDGYLPFKVFNSYVGWQCYEEVYKNIKRYSLYACTEEVDSALYQIPCVKIDSKMLSFNLSNPENVDAISKTIESDDLKNKMVECYLNVMANCESQKFSGVPRPDTRDLGFGTWVFVPGSNIHTCDIETRSKFHIALLSISLIVGFPAVIILFYYCWTSNKVVLAYHRDLLTALVFRTLFTLLIQSEIFLNLSTSAVLVNNGATCKFLASMETIFGNLVWSFFVSEAFYLHSFAKNGFSKEPDIRIYNYILTGISVGFAVIWIIVMAAAHDEYCWLGKRNWIQWINDPLRIIFVILHLALIGDVIRMLLTKLKAVHDDTARILRRISLYTFVLFPLFLLQFALNSGTPEGSDCEDPYFYTLYFVDGIQCAVVSLFFFYFDKQVLSLAKATLGLEKPKSDRPSTFLKGNIERHITTIDATQPKKHERNEELHETSPDVNYSSVVGPEKFEKVMQLYNRLNLTQKPSVTLNEGEPYISCIPEPTGVDRKISTISEYYDVESLNEFHDALQYQSSLSIFHDVNEFFDPNDKALSDENFQKRLMGNVHHQQGESNLTIPMIEKNQINAMQNKIQKNENEVQKSEITREKPGEKGKPESRYQSKYLVHDSDSSSSSESEDSVVEVPMRRHTHTYEGRLSMQSDASSKLKSESDLSIAIPIPEEVEPPDGGKTPEAVLGPFAFNENKTASVENWIKNNEELYAKYLQKKGMEVPAIVLTSEATDLEAKFNERRDEEFVDVPLTQAPAESVAGRKVRDDEDISDPESDTESSRDKLKDARRDSDVGHLLSGSESGSDENVEVVKLTANLNQRDTEEIEKAEEKEDEVQNEEEIINIQDESDRIQEKTPENYLVSNVEVINLPAELNEIEEDWDNLPTPIVQVKGDNFPIFMAQSFSMDDESLSETSDESSIPNQPENESDSELEIEKVETMIPVRKISSSSDSSRSSSRSAKLPESKQEELEHSETEKVKKMIPVKRSSSSSDSSRFSNHSGKVSSRKQEESEHSESECSTSGVKDYYDNLASKMFSPSELERLQESDTTQAPVQMVLKEPTPLQSNLTTPDDDINQLPKDILKADEESNDLINLIDDASPSDDTSILREKPTSSLFSQTQPDIYDDLKNYSPNRNSRDFYTGNRKSYSDMFSKYKSKILTDKNKSKSLEDVIDKDAKPEKSLPVTFSENAIVDLDAEENPSRLEKTKGFTNLNAELQNKNTDFIVFRDSESDSSFKNETDSSSSSDDSVEKPKPKPRARRVTSNENDDWEPQKVFY